MNRHYNQKKILWFKAMLPNAVRDGSSMASLNLANALSRRFAIDLASCSLRGNEYDIAKSLSSTFSSIKLITPEGRGSFCRRLFTRLHYEVLAKLYHFPRASFYESSKPVRDYLQNELRRNAHSILHLEYWTAGRLLDLDTEIPRVIYLHDATWVAMEQRAEQAANPRIANSLRRSAQLVKKAEIDAANKADHTHFLSQTDLLHFQAAGVTNGVYIPILMPELKRKARTLAEPNILFLGRLEHFPNVDAVDWFIREVFPIVKRAIPRAKFTIVGPNAPKSVRELFMQPGIEYLGWVDKLEDVLNQSSVAIAPVRIGTGTKLKILELMWHGLPMVVSKNAASGTPAEKGGALVADSAESFAQNTIHLLEDNLARISMRDCAWTLLEMEHCGQRAHEAVVSLFEKIATGKSNSAHS
jgi:glycosyltransferase involved in cell wall biosynthesis